MKTYFNFKLAAMAAIGWYYCENKYTKRRIWCSTDPWSEWVRVFPSAYDRQPKLTAIRVSRRLSHDSTARTARRL